VSGGCGLGFADTQRELRSAISSFLSRGDFARALEGVELFPLLWIKKMVDPSLETRVGYHQLLEEPCSGSRELSGSSFVVIALQSRHLAPRQLFVVQASRVLFSVAPGPSVCGHCH
jgi:hypothetical protein